MSGAGAADTTDYTDFFKARLTSGGGMPVTLSWFFDEEDNNEVNHNMVSDEESDQETLNEESKEYLFRCNRLQK